MKRLHDSDDEDEPATKKAAPSLDKPTDILAQVNVHVKVTMFAYWVILHAFFVNLFYLISFFKSQSTIFQLYWVGLSWVEPVLSKD